MISEKLKKLRFCLNEVNIGNGREYIFVLMGEKNLLKFIDGGVLKDVVVDVDVEVGVDDRKILVILIMDFLSSIFLFFFSVSVFFSILLFRPSNKVSLIFLT